MFGEWVPSNCPFCGGAATRRKWRANYDGEAVRCAACGTYVLPRTQALRLARQPVHWRVVEQMRIAEANKHNHVHTVGSGHAEDVDGLIPK